ncbi:DHH family phosphoesterase [Clostridium sp. DL1XJH146]
MELSSIAKEIMKSNKICITFHKSPDGDSIGSGLGLLQGLIKLNKNVYISSKETLPSLFSYLPLFNKIETNGSISDDTDLLIVLDCGNVERINVNVNFDNRNYKIINIDHHLSNDNYGDINYIDTHSAAVSEIIYALLKSMEVDIDVDIAKSLYTSILTDTGSFRHSNTTKITHEIAGNLISKGFDFSSIHRHLFENISINRLRLQAEIIRNIELFIKDKISLIYVSKHLLNKYDIDEGDTSDIIDLATKIDTIEVAILIKEKTKGTKVSMRSKTNADVRKIAELYGGGGHTKAAGFKSNKNYLEIKNELLTILEKELI